MLIEGACHCGNVRFDLRWEPDPKEIPARECDCTFCRKHGGVWTSNPAATVEVKVREPAKVSKYTFGTGTAVFHICTQCGIVPLVTSEIDGHIYAVVSVNAFENVDPAMIRKAPISFEGEEVGSRLDRRKRNWIRTVRFTQAMLTT
jgi:hypothetical protein